MESEPYVRGPFHLLRCMGQLTVMYAAEKLRDFADMIDDAENWQSESDD